MSCYFMKIYNLLSIFKVLLPFMTELHDLFWPHYLSLGLPTLWDPCWFQCNASIGTLPGDILSTYAFHFYLYSATINFISEASNLLISDLLILHYSKARNAIIWNLNCVSLVVLLLRVYLMVPHILWYTSILLWISLSFSYRPPGTGSEDFDTSHPKYWKWDLLPHCSVCFHSVIPFKSIVLSSLVEI